MTTAASEMPSFLVESEWQMSGGDGRTGLGMSASVSRAGEVPVSFLCLWSGVLTDASIPLCSGVLPVLLLGVLPCVLPSGSSGDAREVTLPVVSPREGGILKSRIVTWEPSEEFIKNNHVCQHRPPDHVHHGRPGALWEVSEASHCPTQTFILFCH